MNITFFRPTICKRMVQIMIVKVKVMLLQNISEILM